MHTTIQGPVYVVGDNIDTDQIIPAEHLSLVPSIAAERAELGKYALSGLPQAAYPERLTATGPGPGATPARFRILIAGRNFGCGSSREHAPIALGAAGIRVVVAESFARIFYRNCIATGEIYPVESKERLCEMLHTGDFAEVDLNQSVLRRSAPPRMIALRPMGEAARVIACGGLFEYARQTGLVPRSGAVA